MKFSFSIKVKNEIKVVECCRITMDKLQYSATCTVKIYQLSERYT